MNNLSDNFENPAFSVGFFLCEQSWKREQKKGPNGVGHGNILVDLGPFDFGLGRGDEKSSWERGGG